MTVKAQVDADVIVRLVAGDDPEKQDRAAALFERASAGELELWVETTTIFDVFFVLTSARLYRFSTVDATEAIRTLVALGGIRVRNAVVLFRALDLIQITRSFGDALIAATMEFDGTKVLYSFDRGFDRIASIERREP